VEGNRDMVLAVSSHNKLSTHNSIRKYFVGNLVTAAPPQYSSAIRLCYYACKFGINRLRIDGDIRQKPL